MAKKRKPGKKHGKFTPWTPEVMISLLILVVVGLVAFSPALFTWLSPNVKKQVERAVFQSAYERAPAKAE